MRIAALILTLVFGLVVGFGLGAIYRAEEHWVTIASLLLENRSGTTREEVIVPTKAPPTRVSAARAARVRTAVPVRTQAPSRSSGVSLANFNRIRDGMSYREVVEILGSDGEVISSGNIGGIRTVMYQWDSNSSSYGAMNAMFQNGQLITKAQFGLD